MTKIKLFRWLVTRISRWFSNLKTMTYLQFIDNLSAYAEEEFAEFQRKLIFTDRKILGVRTPILRRIAKEYRHAFFVN